MRNWLIKLLANGRTVFINATIDGDKGLILKQNDKALVHNVNFNNCKNAITIEE